MRAIVLLFVVASLAASVGCGKAIDAKPARSRSAASVPNTSQISIKKLDSGAVVASIGDKCESLSNIIIPEASDFNTTTAEGSTHFSSSKPDCSTQSDGTCLCTCPSATGFTVMRALEPKVAGAVANYAEVMFCSPVSK